MEYEDNDFDKSIDTYNEAVKMVNEVIGKHNKKTNEFDKVTKEVKGKLELHYVQEQLVLLEYYKKNDDYVQKTEELRKDHTLLTEKKQHYSDLEGELSNEMLGAEDFNSKLELFLGYSDIKLVYDSTIHGYKIERNGKQEAKYLSEGEKTAIAFIYFVTKLKENGNEINNSIIVVDDPISSFDSNKIFSAYAYMKMELEQCKQLFVLTHNYNFYSLILGWFNKKSVKDSVLNKKIANYSVYRIDTEFVDGIRKAMIHDGGQNITQASEYDYVFYHVYKMKDRVLTKEESIFCGNVARKLVESFLSFKFPKQRADLAALLEKAYPNKEDAICKERIYKFINIYSHYKRIDVFEQLDADILESNSERVLSDIIKMIERLDVTHFQAMVEKINKDLLSEK